MTFGVTFDSGEEAIVRTMFDDTPKKDTCTVGLYQDGDTDGDDLTDSSTLGDITTEAGGNTYSRQEVTFGSDVTIEQENGNWTATFDDVTFDVSESSRVVDGVFVVLNYTRTNESTQSNHLLFNTDISEGKTSLSEINGTITIQDMSFTID